MFKELTQPVSYEYPGIHDNSATIAVIEELKRYEVLLENGEWNHARQITPTVDPQADLLKEMAEKLEKLDRRVRALENEKARKKRLRQLGYKEKK